MNERQKEELFFEIRNRIMHVENVVIATAKYLAHIEDLLAKTLAEMDAYKMLLQLEKKE
jgi:hypothetical protein